jgi:hypothetical protein
MGEQMKELQGYVNDMLAVETELHAAFRRQKADAGLKKFPAAHQLVARTEEVIDQHLESLKRCATRLGGESALKQAVGSVLGAAAGLYDKIRGDAKVSRVLRDDNTALTFASVSYQMLHTTALAMRDEATADLALKHMRDLTPIIMDSSQILTEVLVEELSQEGKAPLDRSVVDEANRHTREAWSQGSTLH